MKHRILDVNAQLTNDAQYRYSQTQREVAALNGELGPEAQIIALSAIYTELRGQGRYDEARAIKAQAMAIATGGK